MLSGRHASSGSWKVSCPWACPENCLLKKKKNKQKRTRTSLRPGAGPADWADWRSEVRPDSHVMWFCSYWRTLTGGDWMTEQQMNSSGLIVTTGANLDLLMLSIIYMVKKVSFNWLNSNKNIHCESAHARRAALVAMETLPYTDASSEEQLHPNLHQNLLPNLHLNFIRTFIRTSSEPSSAVRSLMFLVFTRTDSQTAVWDVNDVTVNQSEWSSCKHV